MNRRDRCVVRVIRSLPDPMLLADVGSVVRHLVGTSFWGLRHLVGTTFAPAERDHLVGGLPGSVS